MYNERRGYHEGTRRSSILAVGILLIGLCLGVTGAWAQFTVDVTIDAVTLDQFGVVTVSGTVTCSETANFVGFDIVVRQPVGKKDALVGCVSRNFEPVVCDNTTPLEYSIPVINNGCFDEGGSTGGVLAQV